jgi:hypothetical protein
VNETSALLHDPHLEAVGFFAEQETALGKVRFPGRARLVLPRAGTHHRSPRRGWGRTDARC